jgi:hypothetical protein
VTSENGVEIRRRLVGITLTAVWAAILTRISMACMLLQLNISRSWRLILWGAIFIQLGMAIGASVSQLTQCRPVRALWVAVPNATCLNPVQSGIASYTLIGMNQARRSQ